MSLLLIRPYCNKGVTAGVVTDCADLIGLANVCLGRDISIYSLKNLLVPTSFQVELPSSV